mmetsp:Transcript_4341/g.12321  ORF Transcript_4341/g.12321 Transcript_4341/m.12321 type:complete len:200 (-) Transcript_4341:3365-3964(-)
MPVLKASSTARTYALVGFEVPMRWITFFPTNTAVFSCSVKCFNNASTSHCTCCAVPVPGSFKKTGGFRKEAPPTYTLLSMFLYSTSSYLNIVNTPFSPKPSTSPSQDDTHSELGAPVVIVSRSRRSAAVGTTSNTGCVRTLTLYSPAAGGPPAQVTPNGTRPTVTPPSASTSTLDLQTGRTPSLLWWISPGLNQSLPRP